MVKFVLSPEPTPDLLPIAQNAIINPIIVNRANGANRIINALKLSPVTPALAASPVLLIAPAAFAAPQALPLKNKIIATIITPIIPIVIFKPSVVSLFKPVLLPNAQNAIINPIIVNIPNSGKNSKIILSGSSQV